MSIETINPATETLIKSYPTQSKADVNTILNDVHQAQQHWQTTPFKIRHDCMMQLAQMLKQKQSTLAKIITQEMGKPISMSEAEIAKCALVCEYYAEQAEHLLSPKMIKTNMTKSFISYQPLGTIFAIMPWNFPFWQVFRFAAPNIMAGNAGILSHAPISTGAALAIEDLFIACDFPKNIFRSLIIDNEVAAYTIAHPQIAGVTLTGSERAGRSVASHAGSALKKVVLELGGSDPYVILEDADLEKAAKICVRARLANSGQVCIAAKRLIVEASIYETFKDLVLKEMQTYQMGDPCDPNCNFGPLSRKDIRDQIHKQVCASIEKGANLITGGHVPDRTGFYYPPTALENVCPGMPAFDEEVFGPVITFVKAKDNEQAITLANQTPYGLGAAIFTQDITRGESIATHQLQAGSVCVNTNVVSDPRLPFGGIKQSGYGRELAAPGIHAFMNIKTVCVA